MHFKKQTWSFTVIIVVLVCGISQPAWTFEYKDTVESDLHQTKTILTKDNLLKAGLFTGLFLSSMALDRPIKNVVKHNQSASLKQITDVTNQFGNGWWTFPFVTGLHLIGRATKNEKLAEASFTAMESFFVAGAFCSLGKLAFGRARPSVNDSPFHFKPFQGYKAGWSSLPSEHVTVAWAVVTPYAVYYHQPWLYLLPISTAAARIYKNAHWFSDTVLASGIGFGTAYLLSKWHINAKNSRVAVIPLPQGICLNIKF